MNISRMNTTSGGWRRVAIVEILVLVFECEDIQPSRKWLVYPSSECYPMGDGIEVMSLHGAMQALDAAR